MELSPKASICVRVVIIPAGIGEIRVHTPITLQLNTQILGTSNQKVELNQTDFRSKCLKAHLFHHRADEQGRTPEELLVDVPRFPVLHKPVGMRQPELNFPKKFLLEDPSVSNFTYFF